MATCSSRTARQVTVSLLLALAGCVLWFATTRSSSISSLFRIAPPASIVVGGYHRSLQEEEEYTLFTEDEPIPNLFPFETPDYIGFFCAVAGLILAAGAGIGGGGILVPIFILIFGFPVKHSIPLASVTVLGGAIANNILNASKKQPNGRPSIDWDLMVQLEPMTIAGALVGADLNDFLPDVVLVVLLFLLLTVTAYKTLQKAHKLHEKETEAFRHQEESCKLVLANGGGDGDEGNGDDALKKGDAAIYGSVSKWDNDINGTTNTNGSRVERSDSEIADDRRQIIKSICELSTLFVVVTVLNLLKGGPGEGGGGPAGLDICGPQCYWYAEVGILLLIVAFAAYMRRSILHRIDYGGPVLSEIEWNEHNTLAYPLYAIVAGLVAGMFGVGGGIIKGPLMLALGVHPQVASATSACMILFTSTTATVSYVIFGLLIYDYALGCLLTGFIATLIGQTLMSILMKKYNRNSYIAYTIGIVVGISAIAMTIESVIAILD